jgi:hypothetical protein
LFTHINFNKFKRINLKYNWVLKHVIMKKLILSLVFVLATGSTLMNASVNSIGSFRQDDSKGNDMEWGTGAGEGSEEDEYEYTNSYFEYYCNEDGTYQD